MTSWKIRQRKPRGKFSNDPDNNVKPMDKAHIYNVIETVVKGLTPAMVQLMRRRLITVPLILQLKIQAQIQLVV